MQIGDPQMENRPSWDEYFMNIIEILGKRGTCDRGQSGALAAKDKHILTTGYVGSPAGLPHCDEAGHMLMPTEYSVQKENGELSKHCVRTTHAEQNVICQAAKLGVSLDGATLYCKMEPCFVCAKMIINAGIKRVVCKKRYHAARDTRDFFKQAGIELVVLNDEIEEYANQ